MIIDKLPQILLQYLILTIIIELIVAIVLGLRKKDLIYVILVNIITNPVLNAITTLVYVKYSYSGRLVSITILEIIAFISEGLIYKKTLSYKKINPILLSLILNVFSFTIGLIINNYFI